MSELEPMSNGNAPMSWRDTYRLVGETRTEVLQAIKDLEAALDKRTDDHEVRIRALEAVMERRSGSAQTTAMFFSLPRSVIVTAAAFTSIVVSILALVAK